MPERSTTVTREQILATALELFTVHGYDATSLRQIADRLGFTKAALYYHFPAKEHLAIELTRPWLDAISNLITLDEPSGSPSVDAADRRARLLSDYVDIWISHHAVLRFLSQDIAAMRHPDIGKRARALILALQAALIGPEDDDAARTRVVCAMGVVHSIGLLDEASLSAARPIVIDAAVSVLDAEAS